MEGVYGSLSILIGTYIPCHVKPATALSVRNDIGDVRYLRYSVAFVVVDNNSAGTHVTLIASTYMKLKNAIEFACPTSVDNQCKHLFATYHPRANICADSSTTNVVIPLNNYQESFFLGHQESVWIFMRWHNHQESVLFSERAWFGNLNQHWKTHGLITCLLIHVCNQACQSTQLLGPSFYLWFNKSLDNE